MKKHVKKILAFWMTATFVLVQPQGIAGPAPWYAGSVESTAFAAESGGRAQAGDTVLAEPDKTAQAGDTILAESDGTAQAGDTVLAESGGRAQAGDTVLAESDGTAMAEDAAAGAEAGSAADTPALTLQTPHALVMELTTGKVLYEKDADARVHPASVTKVMTVLLIFEAIAQGKLALEDQVTTSAYAKSMGGSQVFLEEGEVQTVETLLKCILIASGNDAAVAMAEQIGGSEEAFVGMMNEKAAALGMENTHFVDCCGLTDSDDHYTSARDVALMSRELLKNYPQVTEYSAIWMEDITHVTAKGSSIFTLSNTNKLLRAFDGCDGLKTGSTSKAKYCLSATAQRNGIRLVAAVMTSPESKVRFAEAGQLLNYGFSRCTMYYDEQPEALPRIQVRGTIRKQVQVAYDGEFSYLSTENEDFSAIEKTLKWNDSIEAPLAAGTQVGSCVYTLNGREIGSVPIVTCEDVPRAGYLDYLNELWVLWAL